MTTAMGASRGTGSDGNLQVQLQSSAGAVKASATLADYFSEGKLTTWNANGVGFEAGDEIRFRWSSTNGWKLSGLSLEGFTLQGQSAPFWMDLADGCESCNVRVPCSGAGAVQWAPGECYSQLECVRSECATRRVWTVRDLSPPPSPPPSPPSPPPSPPSGGGDGNSTAIIIVVIVAVVVLMLAIVTAVVVLKKKNNVDATTPAVTGTAVKPADVQQMTPPRASPSGKKLGPEKLKELKELKELLDNGVLNQAEFDAQKKAVLA